MALIPKLPILIFLAVLLIAKAASSQTPLPPALLDQFERADKLFEQDRVSIATTHKSTDQKNKSAAWRQIVIENIVLPYWETHPHNYQDIVASVKQRYPWFETNTQIAYSQPATLDIPQTNLFPSSQYVQPSLQAYKSTSYQYSAHATQRIRTPETSAVFKKSDTLPYPVQVSDPLETMNRGVFYFNAKLDQYLFIPVVNTYKFVTPDFLEEGVHNIFENITEILSFGNEILQLDLLDASKTALRFGVNSTVGIGGFFDPASHMGLPQDKEDFGQTLGAWGVPEGPYIVLPVFGPSNLRDTVGLITDTVAFAALDPFTISSTKADYPVIYAIQSVDTRNAIDYRYHMSGSPFEYEVVRYLITKKRQLDIQR